ncbi:MAG: ArsR/SmtB family transcription factor [Candidatus Hodarchaeales archaeon]
MDPTFTDPGEVIPVIKALADPTRLGMLLSMNTASPKGVTASQLADRMGKKIPTILHHLEKLRELGLAQYQMEKNEAGREIKHWRVINPKFLLEINLSVFTDATEIIDDLILYLFEEEKRSYEKDKKRITINYTSENSPKDIKKKLLRYLNETKTNSTQSVEIHHAQEIHSRLAKSSGLEKYLRKWILKAFKDSAASLQLDFFELGDRFVLGRKLQQTLYEHFIQSNKFSAIGYTEEGRPVQRLKLRPEFLDDPDD